MLTDFLGIGQSRSSNPFEVPPSYSTPGYGDEVAVGGNIPVSQRPRARLGMFGNSRSAALAQGQAPDAGAGFGQAPISLMAPDATLEQAGSLPALSAMPGVEPRKPGFFDKGGGWVDALGILGDALAGAAGRPPIYTQMKMQRREIERQQQTWSQKQKAERDEWLWREQWKQAHPDDQFTQFMVAGGIDPRSPQGQALYKQRAEGMAAPPLMAVDGFDAQGNPTKTFMPRPMFAPGQTTPAGPPVGTTRNGYRFKGGNPNDRSSWESVGGASPAGGATFR